MKILNKRHYKFAVVKMKKEDGDCYAENAN